MRGDEKSVYNFGSRADTLKNMLQVLKLMWQKFSRLEEDSYRLGCFTVWSGKNLGFVVSSSSELSRTRSAGAGPVASGTQIMFCNLVVTNMAKMRNFTVISYKFNLYIQNLCYLNSKSLQKIKYNNNNICNLKCTHLERRLYDFCSELFFILAA